MKTDICGYFTNDNNNTKLNREQRLNLWFSGYRVEVDSWYYYGTRPDNK